MADAALVATLRNNIADVGTPPAWSDAELSVLLDAAGGIEPRARHAALLPLWAEAAGRTDYNTGTVSEKASQAFSHLQALLAQSEAEVGALDAADQATQQAGISATVAIPVQVFW